MNFFENFCKTNFLFLYFFSKHHQIITFSLDYLQGQAFIIECIESELKTIKKMFIITNSDVYQCPICTQVYHRGRKKIERKCIGFKPKMQH